MVLVQCPHCLRRYRIDTSRGKLLRVRCPGCGENFIVSPSQGVRHEIAGGHDGILAVVADIQRDFRNAIVGVLHRANVHIILAEDGRTAVAEVLKNRPRLLLVNPYLPGLMGLDVIAEVRKLEAAAPVIILLGAIHDSRRYRRRPESLYGADDYLDESGSDEAVLSKVRFHLHLPMTVDPAAAGEDREGLRLARSVFTDMLVYDPGRMARVQMPDDFFTLFEEEAAEGRRYIESRKPGASALLKEVVAQYLRGG